MDQPIRNLDRTRAALEQSLRDGLTPGAQVCIRRGGVIAAELALGEARPGVAMTTDTLLSWMSMTKPIVAVGVLQQIERGHARLDDPVARFLPEFAASGKADITLRHLLTHTAGLRTALRGESDLSWDEIIARICSAAPEPDWPLGGKAGYHIASSWYVLGEIVRRIDGRMIDAYVREAIFLPLGMDDCWLAMGPGDAARYGDRLGVLYKTGGSEPQPMGGDSPEQLMQVRPGASGRGPSNQLSRFFQMLLNGGELDGRRVLAESTVAEMTARQRTGMIDQTFGHVIDWGLGVMLNSAEYGHLATLPYNFGEFASRDAFGHGGAQSSIAFADPGRDLVAVVILNGQPGEPKHHRRMIPILRALWEDIGFGT